ncbi:head decoration protein [uncultured Martelella sp.]|uniref:head decoration protein n=1 Tax=uncultured Martelella sp. TaxID=392331 RepID=UPI0029C67D62|nr:head decoration protein [uncultured Martelella sp.]
MSLAVYTATKARTLSDLVKWMPEREYSIASYTLLAGDGDTRSISLGTPLGKITAGGTKSAVSAADAGNTGNGTLTLADPAFTATAPLGEYTVVCTTGGADGTSKFRVENPEGVRVGTATGGAAFDKTIKFTIAGGGTDFVEGDSFIVTVSIAAGADDGKIVAWSPTATNGSQVIWGFAANAIEAADGVDNVGNGLAVRRQAILRDGGIQWPEGLSATDKAAAVENVEEKRGIVVRV